VTIQNSPLSDQKPLADSPWFWIYLFATFGLVALFWMGPKYAERQAQLDRQFQGRQFAASPESTDGPPTTYSRPSDKLLDLRWLGYALAIVLAVAWGRLCWQHFRAPRNSGSTLPENQP